MTAGALLVLSFAIVAAAALIRSGLRAVARAIDARNALLSMIGKQRTRAPGYAETKR